MRCSCRVCGTYMVQVEHGLQSGCKCPDCGTCCGCSNNIICHVSFLLYSFLVPNVIRSLSALTPASV